MRRIIVPWLIALMLLVGVSTVQAGNVGPCCSCVCGKGPICETPVVSQVECDAACAGAAQQCQAPFDAVFFQQDNCGLGSPPCPAAAAPAGVPALSWVGLLAALLAVGLVGRWAVRRA
jgi:hypothetical protein